MSIINKDSPFIFAVKPTVNDIDLEVVIEARNTETGEIYVGKTNGWSSTIPRYDLYRICADGITWNHPNSILTARINDQGEIHLVFRVVTYAISNLVIDAKLNLVKPKPPDTMAIIRENVEKIIVLCNEIKLYNHTILEIMNPPDSK